jgi:hypothetical protein
MDDYAALVDRTTGDRKIFDKAATGHDYLTPYWTTEGLDGTCWISLSGSDAVAVLDFDSGQELAFLPVGDHPQRVRHGVVPESVVASWTPTPPTPTSPTGVGALVAAISGVLSSVLGALSPLG